MWLLSICCSRTGRTRAAILFALAGTVLLGLSSLPVFSNFVLTSLQQDYPFISPAKMPVADAVVILGGGVAESTYEDGLPQLGRSINRLIYGIELYKAGKAPLFIVSGGSASNDIPEADIMAGFLQKLGMREDILIKESRSRTTYENARYTLPLLRQHDIHSIILVTSAFHMRRARASFSALGIDVIPGPVDHTVLQPEFRILNWLPDIESLYWSTKGYHEYLGWLYYRVQGWVQEHG